ncbi:hypothetical protein GDO86_016124 [Hymenochirus boettgeri]|uniref:KASH domain-containing protein n=1 Tax=Hymenochirus boettgeri TaxID=247094 RepID=A0A8T2K0R9_9PIPI|nr:hypothetical protein GDO86_016124 [Hymenochirus boettgeri]
MVLSLIADWKEFVEEKEFVSHLQSVFQGFLQLSNQLSESPKYSDDSEISQEYETIKEKYNELVESTHLANSNLEKILSAWTRYENNISLITGWLDEQKRIPPLKVPAEILSKWRSVQTSLNNDGMFLISIVHEKTAAKLSKNLKCVNTQWAKYVKLYEKMKREENGSCAPVEPRDGDDTRMLIPLLPISTRSLRQCIENLQGPEENTQIKHKCKLIYSHVELIETLMESAGKWPSTAETFLGSIDHLGNIEESIIKELQKVHAQGCVCQEQIAEAKKNLKVVQNIIHRNDEMRHFDTSEIQNNITKMQKKVQTLMSMAGQAVIPPELHLSESDIRNKFESSKANLETYITAAMCLMKQRVTPDKFIAQYEETLGAFDSENLNEFLKAANQMKSITTTKEKSAVDEVSADLRNRWKIVHNELESYVFQLKIQKEKNKFDDLICTLEKQLEKEEGLIDIWDKEELIKQHKTMFSEDGCQGQLDRCLQAIKQMLGTARNEIDSSVHGTIISECSKKKVHIEKRAGDVYLHLLSLCRKSKTGNKRQGFYLLKSETCKSKAARRSPKSVESVSEHQNQVGCPPCEGCNGSFSTLLDRYGQEKTKLEQFLQTSRQMFTDDHLTDSQDVSSLQKRVCELELLQIQADKCWTIFELVSHNLEKIVNLPEKNIYCDQRAKLHSDLETIKEELKIRIKSLSGALNVLMPIQEKVAMLCQPSKPDQELEKFTLSTINSAFLDLKDAQCVFEDHIQQCDILESSVDDGRKLNHEAIKVVQCIKKQLETSNETMREREMILKDLEKFLFSINAIKVSIDVQVGDQEMDSGDLEKRLKNLDIFEDKISHLKQEAQQLDECLGKVDIFLEDPERGAETTCFKLISDFQGKVDVAKKAVLKRFIKPEIQSPEDTFQFSLSIQQERSPLCESSEKTLDQSLPQFSLPSKNLVLQNIKGIQSSAQDGIQKSSSLPSPVKFSQELNLEDFQERFSTLCGLKVSLKESPGIVEERESVLNALQKFIYSIKTIKLNIKKEIEVTERDRNGLQVSQINLKALENKVYQLEQDAYLLDGSLDSSGVILEHPGGRTTSCQELISGFSDKIENAKKANLQDLGNLQHREDNEMLATKQIDLCKNVKDIYDQVERIGLSDPTIPSVQQRIKHLDNLENELISYSSDKTSIPEGQRDHLQHQEKGFNGDEEFEILWEDTRQYIIYCKEQCEKVKDRMRRFQKCKAKLSSVIDKGESAVSQQSSYVGKENLLRKLSEIDAVKQEFSELSEDIDQLDCISRELEFHLNKMKSFRELPFLAEAHRIVDKWLDVKESVDGYSENLKGASCLWNKILHLSDDVDQWTEDKIKVCKECALSMEDISTLLTEFQEQEQKIQEISKQTLEIQNVLQTSESPLELQGSDLVNHEKQKDWKSWSEGSILKNGTIGFESEDRQTKMLEYAELPDPKSALKRTHHTGSQTAQQSKSIKDLKLKLSDLMKKKEYLYSNLQPDLQEKVKQLESFTEFFQEVEDFTNLLEESKPEDPAPLGSSPGVDEWQDMQYIHNNMIKQLQDKKQILENQIHCHQQYEHLTDTLNSKITSFSQELLNFPGSSLESPAGEQKRQKLQTLDIQFEEMAEDLKRALQLSADVKQNTSAPGVTAIQETMRNAQFTLRHFKENLQNLQEDVNTSLSADNVEPVRSEITDGQTNSLITDSVKIKKTGRGRKKKKALPAMVASSDSVFYQTEYFLKNLQEWLHNSKIKLETYRNSQCNEDRFTEKICRIQGLCDEIVQKKIDLDVIDKKSKNAEKKELMESRDAGRWQQEASGQLQKLLNDCDLYRRQLETSQKDLNECANEFQKISSLLKTLEDSLAGYETSSEGSDKHAMLNKVQPLYEEVESFVKRLDKACSQASGQNISCRANKQRKDLKKRFTHVTEKMICLSQAVDTQEKLKGDIVQNGDNGMNNSLQEHQQSSPNKTTQSSDVWLTGSQQPSPLLAESNISAENSRPMNVQYQKDIEDILCRIQIFESGGTGEVEKQPKERSFDWLAFHSKIHFTGREAKNQGEDSQEECNIDNIERKISYLKKLPVGVDVLETNRQFQENESEETPQFQKEESSKSSPPTEPSLVCEKNALKAQERKEGHTVRELQNALWAAKHSLLLLSKENLKMGASECLTAHSGRIKEFLGKVLKEKSKMLNLKSEYATICCSGMSVMDKEKIEHDVDQLEECWEQLELTIQKKHDFLEKGAEEITFLKQQVTQIKQMIEAKHQLLDHLEPSANWDLKTILFLEADIKSMKHLLSSLRNVHDVQMKRPWDQNEITSFGSSLDDLQSQVENLEECVSDSQLSGCQTHGTLLNQYPFLKPLYKDLLWVKKSYSKSRLDYNIRLLPQDVTQQVAHCRALQEKISDKKTLLDSNIEELKHTLSGKDVVESEALTSFFHQLQLLYQERYIHAKERLQQLENGLEKRKALFLEIEKLTELLQYQEKEAPVKKGIFTAIELCSQLNCLKAKTKELEEIESLAMTLLRDSQYFCSELQMSEYLYLNDILVHLKSRASRLLRQEKKKIIYFEKVLSIYNEFQEKSRSLGQDLNVGKSLKPQPVYDQIGSTGEVSENRLQIAQNTSSYEDRLYEICRYKQLFEVDDLYWDSFTVDSLKIKHSNESKSPDRPAEILEEEQSHYLELLEKIKIMTFSLKEETVCLIKEFDIVESQVVCAKIMEIINLVSEAVSVGSKLPSDIQSKCSEEQKLKVLTENLRQLHDYLISIVSEIKKENGNSQNLLNFFLNNLKKINKDLQQPLHIDLDVNNIHAQLSRLKTLEKTSKLDVNTARATAQPDANEQMSELDSLEKSIKDNISSRRNALSEACNILQKAYNTINKAIELFVELETQLRVITLNFSSFDGSKKKHLLSLKEQLNSIVAEVENLIRELKINCNPEAKELLDNILGKILARHALLNILHGKKQLTLDRCQEKHFFYKELSQKICIDLKELETDISDSCLQKPVSYKEALLHWENSKTLVTKLGSCEEELMSLRRAGRELEELCKDSNILLVDKVLKALWGKWLYLLDIAQNWELHCEEQKQEWKLINEEMEREMILLDKFQEEMPEKFERKEGTQQLLDSLLELNYFMENLNMQQLHLSLLLQRIQNIQSMPENCTEAEMTTACKEIQAMQEKCKKLYHKVSVNERDLHTELQEREKLNEEIASIRRSLQKLQSTLLNTETTDFDERRVQLEKLQTLINIEKEKSKCFMEKIRIQYSGSIPEEFSDLVEECQVFLEETEEKVNSEIEQCSPSYIMTRKVEEIKAGYKSIESLLAQKSENITEAKELEKKMWDEMDIWRCKLNALEAEVHDIGEENPCLIHEWMDNLTEPFHECQRISCLVEGRTANLNKAATKLEEYDEILKSMEFLIQNTSKLLSEGLKNCSARVLSKHVTALKMALDDLYQKQTTLGNIYSELGELAVIFETESTEKHLRDISSQVTELQKRILGILPHISYVAEEVGFIEGELKTMAKRKDTIKTLLTSNDIVDMPPKEHYRNGQVILENIEGMKKTAAEIEAYRPSLRITEAGIHSLCVFRRIGHLLEELDMLEKATREKNGLLEPIIDEMTELEQEQEKLKHLLKHSTNEAPDVKEKYESIRLQLEELNQKKDDILLVLRISVTEKLEHLLVEQQKKEIDAENNTEPEEVERTDYGVLPSLAEESEEAPLDSEVEDEETVPSGQSDLLEPEGKSKTSNIDLSSTLLSVGFPQNKINTVAALQTDLEMILCECQGRVTEVELWLQRLNVSLESSKQDPEMQQTVEQQLADCQKTLLEIEKKICTLLEVNKRKNQGNLAAFKEAETLSLKLKALRSSLEQVQAMLQVKPNDEQIHNGRNVLFKTEDILEPSQMRQSDSAAVDRMTAFNREEETHSWNEVEQVHLITQSPLRHDGLGQVSDMNVGLESNITLSATEAVSWSKWQYLQKQLSERINNIKKADIAKEVKIRAIPSFSASRMKLPATEGLRNVTIQFKALAKEVCVPQSEEDESYTLKTLFSWFYSFSQCLQNTSEMLAIDFYSKEEAVSQHALLEKMMDELDTLHSAMTDNKETLLMKIADTVEGAAVISQCYNDLCAWLLQTRISVESKLKCIQQELEKNNIYENDIQQLYEAILGIRTDILKGSGYGENGELSEQIQRFATSELKGCENRLSLLKEQGDALGVPEGLNQDICKVEDVLDDTWRVLQAKQLEGVLVSVSRSQQNFLWHGTAELLTHGKEKIFSSKKYRPISKEAFTSYLENYRNFFNILDNHVLWLQIFTSEIPLPNEGKESLVQEAISLQKEAEAHGIEMMSILRGWRDFDSRHDLISQWLEDLLSVVPAIGLVEESEERVSERINQYMHIKKQIDDSDSRVSQVIADGKKLITLVNSPEVEDKITTLEHQWSQLTKKTTHELHRLESLIKHLGSYNRDSAELGKWLESADQRLTHWKMQSLDASQDLETVRNNLTKFFEFTNDVDQKSSLKTSVLNTGFQLLRLKESDTALLKVSLAKYEEKWGELITGWPLIQEKLQQLLMEKFPSQEAIYELMLWMEQTEYSKKAVDEENAQNSLSHIQKSLQMCKDFRREMNHKQWIVDFVNQSVLQLSAGDVESKRYEKTEFAECLGTMNLQWHQLQGDVNKKIQHLEQTTEVMTENENKIHAISNWFDVQLQRLEKSKRPFCMSAAEFILANCKDLENQLITKSTAIEDLKKDFAQTRKEGSAVTENLFKKRDIVVSQVAEIKSHMDAVLQNWKAYEENYEDVNKMTVKLLYVLGQSKPSESSLPVLQKRLKKLQSLVQEVEQKEERWKKLKDSLDRLTDSCSPSAATLLQQNYLEAHTRWDTTHQEMACHIQAAQALLQLWEGYHNSYSEYKQNLGQLSKKCDQLVHANISEDKETDTLEQRMLELQELEEALKKLKLNVTQVSRLSDKVLEQDPSASDIIQSQCCSFSQELAALERRTSSKHKELTIIMNEVKAFKKNLESLQAQVLSSASIVDEMCLSEVRSEDKLNVIKQQLFGLSELSADIEHMNEESFTLPLDDSSLKMLLNLNRLWAKTAETALAECRELQVFHLEKNNFVQNYEIWMQSVEKMENSLTGGIAGTLELLQQQQRTYEGLLAEIAINEHILPSFVSKALNLLDSGEVENRMELILKLTALKEKWQNVIRLLLQRKKEINTLLNQWRYFNSLRQRLRNDLADIQNDVASVSGEKYHSLSQMRKLLCNFKNKELCLKRWQNTYSTAIHYSKDLMLVADSENKVALRHYVTQLEEQWESTMRQLQSLITKLNVSLQKWQSFEWSAEERSKMLYNLKLRVNEPLPTQHEELQKAKEPIKELEESLDEWNQSLRDLGNMKAELSHYILAEDGIVLKKQIEALHLQWGELCLREIEDKLNAWNVFNEKNKELCEWLTQMESKVLQTADFNIEEMIEKLQKDCMEEINLFSQNKIHLKQLGDQLIIASNKARTSDIDNKLNKINDRWQHLFDVIGSRVKKLKDTLVVIQQLDKNMSNLRTWLAQIESELSKPVIYSICDEQEIQKKLTEQQDLQKDIELHTSGVASVLNICERLLHDTDACANETECDSIQQTTRSLDKRWRNICAMSMERRLRIEETWRLWQKFLEDYSRFEEWLREAEATAAFPESSEVLYTRAKEEQKKFEAFQRQIHERLTHLELVNKQYRRLARENRTDAASKLKEMVHQGNQRWDNLQRRVATILKRLKHFTSQREEFEGTRDSILVWLTEMDLQLTNVEHFSESDIEDKMRQLNEFQQQITLNTNKIDQLIVSGEHLIQKSEMLDAVVIEEELEELHRYCQEVFGRVSRFHQRLTSRNLQLEEERETSENDTDAEDSRETANSSWHSSIREVESSHPSICHLMPPTLPHERSGRETPVSVDSIPLEWDHTGDVGGSSSHEDEEEGTYFNALSGKPDGKVTSWRSPNKLRSPRKHSETEQVRGPPTTTTGTNTTFDLTESVMMPGKEEEQQTTLITENKQLRDKGLLGIESPETYTGVIERWEIIQAQSLSDELRVKQNLQQKQQLNMDLSNISLWLEKTMTDLKSMKTLQKNSTLQELAQKVKKLKDMLKAFESFKALVISANLSSKDLHVGNAAECGDVLNRLHRVNIGWDRVCLERDKRKESLQSELIQCKEFHETTDKLLFWLKKAEEIRLQSRVVDNNLDPDVLLEKQKDLMQLEQQLLGRQVQVNSLQDISSYLLNKTAGDEQCEADEKVHVVGSKLRQLLKEVSQDLQTIQFALDNSAPNGTDSVDSIPSDSQIGATSADTVRMAKPLATIQDASQRSSLFCRVLRAAFPFQLLLLLLLLLACIIPYSEEDFSCAHANNFARSFYPMLRYTNGPPPT